MLSQIDDISKAFCLSSISVPFPKGAADRKYTFLLTAK